MSKAARHEDAAPVRLPTAAPRTVRQRASSRDRLAAIEAGTVVALPPEHWASPDTRRQRAAEAAERAVYEAGGLTDAAPLMLAAAVFTALAPAQREAALAYLNLGACGQARPGPRAALTFAEGLDRALTALATIRPERI